MKAIRLLLADEHALIRTGIRALLEEHSEMQIVAESNGGPETLRLISQHQPDVALMKIEMSKSHGFDLVERVRNEFPEVYVVVLVSLDDEESLTRALGCGAAGFLSMDASADELRLAIKTVANGKTHISSSAKKTLTNIVRHRLGNETLEGLTLRQREVLKSIAEGKSTKQIALELNISVKTVETHRTQLTQRLGIYDTARLVRYAIKAGLIRLND